MKLGKCICLQLETRRGPGKMRNMTRFSRSCFRGSVLISGIRRGSCAYLMSVSSQFFLGDYRPLVRDTFGGVLDQVNDE